MIPCEGVSFSRPVLVSERDPRSGYQSGFDSETMTTTRVFWCERTGQVLVEVNEKRAVVVPPEGSVIRGLERLPAEEKTNGQQQPAASNSPPPARPIQKSGRVQR